MAPVRHSARWIDFLSTAAGQMATCSLPLWLVTSGSMRPQAASLWAWRPFLFRLPPPARPLELGSRLRQAAVLRGWGGAAALPVTHCATLAKDPSLALHSFYFSWGQEMSPVPPGPLTHWALTGDPDGPCPLPGVSGVPLGPQW